MKYLVLIEKLKEESYVAIKTNYHISSRCFKEKKYQDNLAGQPTDQRSVKF